MNTVAIEGVALSVYQHVVDPERPTLIFLHDSLGCITLWREFPQQLGIATHCNILIYDRQGYGKSDPFADGDRNKDYLEKEATVLHQLMDQAGIEKAILFGHSDGGSIALLAAAKYPNTILGVITEGAHIFVEDITLKGIREAVYMYNTTNLQERLEKYHGHKTEAVFWAWAKTWLTDEYRSWNIEGFLPHIHCPVLVIQGESDEYGTLKQVNGITSQVSGEARQLIIPAIGHTPHKEAKEIVLEQTTLFIKHLLEKRN